MSKEVKRYDAQKLKPWSDETGEGFCVVEARDYEALLAERDSLAKAAQRVLDGLNARIDEAVMLGGPVPVFEGIADLHDALQGAKP
jgi:hypothetical protein